MLGCSLDGLVLLGVVGWFWFCGGFVFCLVVAIWFFRVLRLVWCWFVVMRRVCGVAGRYCFAAWCFCWRLF